MSELAPRRRSRAKFVLLMGAMAALPAVSTDMYLPSLPEVATDLDTTPSLVQATITGVLIGGAVGQLLIGPLSDRFGRRRPVLIGIGLHVVASVLCMFVAGIVPLLVLRVIQGVGNASATTTAMAVIRDRHSGATAAAILSRLMLVIGLAPLLAPTLGSLVAGVSGWRGVFGALAVFGAVLMVVVWRFLPETLPPQRRQRNVLGGTLRGYLLLVRDVRFMALALMPGLVLGMLMSYVAGSPFVFRGEFGMGPTEFALYFALNGVGIVLGAQVNASLVRRFEPMRIMRAAMPVSLACAAALFIISLQGTGGVLGVAIPLWLLIAVNAVIPPNATALALTSHGERAGTAAALIGAMQAGVAGAVSPLVGLVGEGAPGDGHRHPRDRGGGIRRARHRHRRLPQQRAAATPAARAVTRQRPRCARREAPRREVSSSHLASADELMVGELVTPRIAQARCLAGHRRRPR